jgi:hypothetical protein
MKLITHEVDDCLRYTVVIPTASYTSGVSTIISRLTSSDATDTCAVASNINAYNFWSNQKGVSTYMGINAFVTLHADSDDDDDKDGMPSSACVPTCPPACGAGCAGRCLNDTPMLEMTHWRLK